MVHDEPACQQASRYGLPGPPKPVGDHLMGVEASSKTPLHPHFLSSLKQKFANTRPITLQNL